jgi:diketogulonate reductase-like aldo/keto reductase
LKLFFLLSFFIGGIVNLFPSIAVDVKNGVCKIDQVPYPIVGFGTYPLTGATCTRAVEQAAGVGYRIIDTATYYRNFDGIAKALKGEDRSQFYLISKVWYDDQSPEDLQRDLDAALKALQTGYLDAYFLHWPNSSMSIEKTLAVLDDLRKAKKVHHIGLSNVSVNHVKRALEVGVPITWVQVEMHPHFCDFELIKFCHEHSIGVQAWAPLGRGRISKDPLLTRIGKKYGKSASQVAIKWIIQHGCIPLPGSKNEKHLHENFEIHGFMLSEDEMAEIDKRAKGGGRERFSIETLGLIDEFDFSYEECWPRNIDTHNSIIKEETFKAVTGSP